MAKYDGLIIPRSYNDYINKSDPLGVAQALQLTGVMDAAPTAASTKPAKSGGIFAANAVIMASSATLTGVAISAGSVVRILFTADLTGSNTTTGLQLTYNGTAYAVKVGKNGALANFNAYEVESGVFKYLQAYTTLELMFDGTQFIIIGNPVVLSSADYTIYPDGLKRVDAVTYNSKDIVTSGAVYAIQSRNHIFYEEVIFIEFNAIQYVNKVLSDSILENTLCFVEVISDNATFYNFGLLTKTGYNLNFASISLNDCNVYYDSSVNKLQISNTTGYNFNFRVRIYLLA